MTDARVALDVMGGDEAQRPDGAKSGINLDHRKMRGIAELGRQNNVSSRYISQIIKFAFLDPALVMRIFRGDIPHDLTLGKLKANLESDWTKQQALFQPAQQS